MGSARAHSLWVVVVFALFWAGGLAGFGQSAPARLVAPGVWFFEGDSHAGYSNSIVIEMERYLILVDPSYPARSRELMQEIPALSPKPVRFVFDTHAHGDHAYGNAVWTRAGATTLATSGAREEMDRYEPERWETAESKREDVRSLGMGDAERPTQVFHGRRLVLADRTRRVEFLFLGWAHTRGDGWVWLPRERILCTGDAAVNGPRNKLWDADVANWPRVLDKAVALRPRVVLPGHGAAGGAEILTGEARFLRDLYAAVEEGVRAGKPLAAIQGSVTLPSADANWVRPDTDVLAGIVYAEIEAGKPAGALPHTWK